MIEPQSVAAEAFNNEIGIKFQLYNSLFLSLPFHGIDKTGIMLSLFSKECEDGYDAGQDPGGIIDKFFDGKSDEEKLGTLFKFVQYVERQVVLFDALEDAAFPLLHDTKGPGTLSYLEAAAVQSGKRETLIDKLGTFSIRPVLTAHPTQFYPGSVLGIINDLVKAINTNNIADINLLLRQLGRTPFLNKEKPTPAEEAASLIWYLENVFYHSIGGILSQLARDLGVGSPTVREGAFQDSEAAGGNATVMERADKDDTPSLAELIRMGFWPGGDRDGNPFVTAAITEEVGTNLRTAILRCYYRDVRALKRRLTFSGVDTLLNKLENDIYAEAFRGNGTKLTQNAILKALAEIREMLVEKHNGLFVHLVDDLTKKAEAFGMFFASIDIRQDSSVHEAVLEKIAASSSDTLPDNYASLSDAEKIDALLKIDKSLDAGLIDDELARETLLTASAMKKIRAENGPEGCERYVISHCESPLDVIEVYGLLKLGGFASDDLDIDIVPLFETIEDLKNSANVMRELYKVPQYREHLRRRHNKQTVMLGFSDGTKDGGYLMANWSIYKAKDDLTKLARDNGIDIIFFDGRGGPPARGGGKTQKFYSSMGRNIEGDSIQLTVQGQTVSSNFGTVDAARYNLEQLLNAGLNNLIFSDKRFTFSEDEEELLAVLAARSFDAYSSLKNDPAFLEYLAEISPLRFYSEANIGSRPSKRGKGKMTLDDLRAIPFVGAWSQIKQNVPGFYGVGSALDKMRDRLPDIARLYRENLFFKTLIDNCEMAMQKSWFPLTAFLAEDERFGPIWKKIHAEYELCRKLVPKVSGKEELMSAYPVEHQSVMLREKIVVPLITIQQYALTKLRSLAEDSVARPTLEKLVIRCSFGIINAGRNSA